MLDSAERWTRRLGAVAGLGMLTAALLAIFRSLRRPAGREERGARMALRWPVLAVMTAGFFGLGARLWRPLPARPSPWQRAVLLAAGAPLYLGGLALYLWGLRSLGAMFAPSSGFGVRLHADQRLVTDGPYAWVRHPMYTGVIGAGIGAALLYRTWAALWFAVIMLGLAVRARREENVLAQEFGAEWEAYTARVPALVPRVWRKATR